MARYDLSVSPHSEATFTNRTGFPANPENSTRRPDSAVAWNSCSCIDAVVASCKMCLSCFVPLGRNEYARIAATNTANIFPKICQTTLRRPTLGRARVCLWHTAVAGAKASLYLRVWYRPPYSGNTRFSSFRLKVTKFGSRADRRIERDQGGPGHGV
jgi:hypothetical protein